MYRLLLFLFLVAPLVSASQTIASADTITTLKLGDSTFSVPPGCKANSAYQFVCDNYQMSWVFFPNEQVVPVLEGTLAEMEKQLPNFTKEKTEAFLFGIKRDAYKLHFTKEGQPIHQLIVYGTLGDHAVVVQVIQDHAITRNADLPEFARKILALDK